ncbi:GTP pyrophosphokinase [Neptunomonas phycophila]|uniref:GTP pyrophosphokinase n=1 Tax=Neptunomonas phycophila TaxID=1572645 RepID=A0AAW7XJU5_9GAMM|nr:GTP pyrophosphokinase [Neptunomonas phycophila]MDO6454574.1 GTP pyrophosphokinase [Neptunomonas phycophila]
MSNLDQAISIAVKAHSDQFDKAGRPYILHPLRLMFRFEDEPEMIVAVMHDVIEDSDFTYEDLKKLGFSTEVIAAIDCLTRRENEDYENFILRASQNILAKKIKIEDIKDNLDLTRLNNITKTDLQRIEKYHRALKVLDTASK